VHACHVLVCIAWFPRLAGSAVVNFKCWILESTMKDLFRFVREDEGQDLVEYALLITFISLACIVGMQQLGTAINNNYNSISQSLAS
jgi:Flp pilus assembly pilin Flp